MHFAPDTEDAIAFLVDLGNTHADATRSGDDELVELDQLQVLLVEHEYSGRIDRDDAELAEVRAVREELRMLWAQPRDDQVEHINRWLRQVRALPFLSRHDRFDWHLHATEPDAPLADRIRAEGALALADIVRSDETWRMRVCAAQDCTGLLLDQSRNGSRRFCSVRCGNRVNQQGYRERMA